MNARDVQHTVSKGLVECSDGIVGRGFLDGRFRRRKLRHVRVYTPVGDMP